MRFDYTARDGAGQPHSGQLEATDAADAIARLAAQGMTPTSLQARSAAPARRAAGGRIKLADQVVLLRELATLLTAGVTLGDALPSLVQAYEGQPLGAAGADGVTGARWRAAVGRVAHRGAADAGLRHRPGPGR